MRRFRFLVVAGCLQAIAVGCSYAILVAGCSHGVAPSAMPSRSAPSSLPPVPAVHEVAHEPIARVVVQPRGDFTQGRTATPDHVWLFGKNDGFSMIDGDSGAAVATLPTWDFLRDVALSRDGRDVFLVVRDRRQIHDGIAAPGLWSPRVNLERWSLETGRLLWSRTLGGRGDGDQLEHIGVSERGVVLTQCMLGHPTSCTAYDVVAETGELRKRETFSVRIDMTLWGMRVESATGKFVLRGIETDGFIPDWDPQVIVTSTGGTKPYQKPPTLPVWKVLDDRGHIIGAMHAGCARFDREDVLWLAYTTPSDIAAARALGIDAREGSAACTPKTPVFPAPPYTGPESGVKDMAWMTATNTHLVWKPSAGGSRPVYALDAEHVGLPGLLALPPAQNGTAWTVEPTGPELLLWASRDLISFSDVGAAPVRQRLQRDAFVWRDGDVQLDGWFIGTYTLALALSTTATPTWRTIDVRANPRLPAFGVIDYGGRQTALIATGKSGLAWVDVKTGRVVKRRTDNATGLAIDPDRKTAWTLHEETGDIRVQAFQQIDVASGDVVRSIPAPDLESTEALGWIVPGEEMFFMSDACLTTVSIARGAEVQHCFGGRSVAVDPRGRYIATFRQVDTVEIRSPSGELVLTTAVRGADAFALAPDGRFACTGDACADLRCVVGTDVRPVTDRACAKQQVSGFSIVDEVERRRR